MCDAELWAKKKVKYYKKYIKKRLQLRNDQKTFPFRIAIRPKTIDPKTIDAVRL